jgi:hypothetical protein
MGWHAGRRGALVLGCVAAVVMGIVGCTSIISGTATVDSADVPVYRASVSASIATSSSRESQRQKSLTRQAVRSACVKFAKTSEEAVTATNDWVEAVNKGADPNAVSGPAVDALNRSADEVVGAINKAMSSQLRAAFNDYASAARSVADAIGKHASISVYNARKDHLNEVKGKAFDLCGDF